MYRRCGSTIKVNDVTIPQGVSVVIPILVVHKNPLFWPESNKFDPERYNSAHANALCLWSVVLYSCHSSFIVSTKIFTPVCRFTAEEKEKRPKLAHIPFGLGILQRFTFFQSPETELQCSYSVATV